MIPYHALHVLLSAIQPLAMAFPFASIAITAAETADYFRICGMKRGSYANFVMPAVEKAQAAGPANGDAYG